MQKQIEIFDVGTQYSNEEIYTSLEVGNTGGIRVKLGADGKARRIVVFTSLSTPRQIAENPYADRLEGDTFIFTGTGRAGEQTVTGFNARICEQVESGVPIYAFTQIASRRSVKVGTKRWCFIGLLAYVRCYQEHQMGMHGEKRLVWIFEFKLLADVKRVLIENDADVSKELIASLPAKDDDDRLVDTDTEITTVNTGVDTYTLEETRRKLLMYEPKQFEIFVGELLKHSGFEDIHVTRYSQDGGIDINAKLGLKAWPLRHLLTQIQAKRWRHTVGRSEVADLRGSLQPFAAGCIVTTSHFSKAALLEATAAGKNPVTTIDGIELARIVTLAKGICV